MGLWRRSPWRRRGPSSGFGAASTAEDVTAGIDATNLTVIVTGATNGIGKETARVLALRGATVIIPARTLESGLKVKESLADQVPASKLHVMEMDLSSLSSVRDFARSFNSSHEHLNILMRAAYLCIKKENLTSTRRRLQSSLQNTLGITHTLNNHDPLSDTRKPVGQAIGTSPPRCPNKGDWTRQSSAIACLWLVESSLE